MKIVDAANYAEIINSSEVSRAINSTWEHDPVGYDVTVEMSKIIIAEAVGVIRRDFGWEARRLAAIKSLEDEKFGNSPFFKSYFTEIEGNATPIVLSKEEAGIGEPGPVKTNYLICAHKETITEPISFFEEAISTINDRNKFGPGNVGIENYATSIKFLADKIMSSKDVLGTDEQEKINEMLQTWYSGFKYRSLKEQLNFIELTNISFAVRTLRKDSMPKEFTRTFVTQALKELPNMSRQGLFTVLGAITKLNPEEVPAELGILTELVIDGVGQFERTFEFRTGLRAIANLEPGVSSQKALKTMFEKTHLLEDSLGIEGLDDIVYSLKLIMGKTVSDPVLAEQAKILAIKCANKAKSLHDHLDVEVDITPEYKNEHYVSVRRIVENALSIKV